jgi:hypothetical protein
MDLSAGADYEVDFEAAPGADESPGGSTLRYPCSTAQPSKPTGLLIRALIEMFRRWQAAVRDAILSVAAISFVERPSQISFSTSRSLAVRLSFLPKGRLHCPHSNSSD